MIKKVLYTNGFPVSDTQSTNNHFLSMLGVIILIVILKPYFKNVFIK